MASTVGRQLPYYFHLLLLQLYSSPNTLTLQEPLYSFLYFLNTSFMPNTPTVLQFLLLLLLLLVVALFLLLLHYLYNYASDSTTIATFCLPTTTSITYITAIPLLSRLF